VNDLLIVTALRTEYAALAGRVPGATLARCGMGPEKVQEWLPRLSQLAPKAVVVVGVAGGLDPTLRPGDVVVATEVRDERGRIVQRAAAPLVAELRRLGLRVRTGPMVSSDHIVRGTAARARLAATGAIAVDMESAAIVRAAAGVPTAVVRVIVDTAYRPMTSLNTATAGARALMTLHKMGPALRQWADLVGPRRVLLAAPRSFCAGVERAIDIVELALQRYPRPVYVRRQIVHNAHVVADLQRQGAVFVEELDQVPDGTTVVFSAHGVAPAVRAEAARRGLNVIDARRFTARGDTVLLIGHAGHDEVEGTMGEAPGKILLVENVADAERVSAQDPEHVSFLMQTTLAVDDAMDTVDVLRRRFPSIESSATDDICYATTNRQQAVRAIAAESDVMMVLGSANSSNSVRLVEVAERLGVRAHLVDDANDILPEWLDGASTIGITAGASAPPHLVDEVIETLRALGPVDVIERAVAEEDVTFSLPKGVAG
jgi:4-hydroxy-3-methylbut-2-enyl diphosphate reductase